MNELNRDKIVSNKRQFSIFKWPYIAIYKSSLRVISMRVKYERKDLFSITKRTFHAITNGNAARYHAV